jgi:hypothetical protein
MNSRFRRPDHISAVMDLATDGTRSNWSPDEVSRYVEDKERRRAGGIPHDFTVLVEPETSERWAKFEGAQKRLWDESLKQRLRSRSPSYQAFAEENSETSKWLTRCREKHDFLKDVPRTMQDALLGQFQAKLSEYYFYSGDRPERWTRSTLDLPLLRFTGSQAQVVSLNTIKLKGLGVVELPRRAAAVRRLRDQQSSPRPR